MAKRVKLYTDVNVLAKLGGLLKQQRVRCGLSLDDIVEMTGFPKSTIINLEKGVSSNIHYYIAFGQAVNISILNPLVTIDLKPRYELSPDRRDKLSLTLRIKDLMEGELFFSNTKTVADIIERLSELYDLKYSKEISSGVSRVLLNLTKDGLIKVAGKKGRNNLYVQSNKITTH